MDRLREKSRDSEMTEYTLRSDRDVAALRQRIRAGQYAVDAHNVAGSIVRKLSEINRARRLMGDQPDDRNPVEGEPIRRAHEARRPGPEPSSR